jgi:ferric-dicitrate binding protein FerR (iron transport regulator)
MITFAQEIETLIIAEIAGSLTVKEQEYLTGLKEKHPEVRDLAYLLHKKLAPYQPEETMNSADAVEKIMEAANVRMRIRRTKAIRTVGMAACVIAVIVTLWVIRPARKAVIDPAYDITLAIGSQLIPLTGKKLKVDRNQGLVIDNKHALAPIDDLRENRIAQLKVPAGKVYTLELSDGTRTFINSASKIEFPLVFSDDARSIKVEGEAYIKVTPDAARPFLVQLPNAEVKALGTAFNVNSYGENASQISLVSGEIIVSSGRKSKTLRPGQSVISSGQQLDVQAFDNQEVLGWTQGIIYLPDADERDVEAAVQRYFGVKLLMHKSFNGQRARIIIDRRESVDYFLNQLPGRHKIEKSKGIYHVRSVSQ